MQKGDDTLPNISLTALAPESQTLIYMVTAPTAYQVPVPDWYRSISEKAHNSSTACHCFSITVCLNKSLHRTYTL